MIVPETIEKIQQQVNRFAECIWEPDDMVEIRLIPSREQKWCSAGDLAKLVPGLTAKNHRGQNVYAGANPRKQKEGSKAEDVALARCLFVDWDQD